MNDFIFNQNLKMENNIIARTKYTDFTGTASLDFIQPHSVIENYAKQKNIDTTLYNLVGFHLIFGEHGGSFSLRFICQEINSQDKNSLVTIDVEETIEGFLNGTRGFEVKLFGSAMY
jgi:hypothetical protein